ncbi:erythromycin esterase family protein [Jiangella sp. DSM 45060]|uniref:erythromycin esterase family protein n=1 Tax=Jiangella sp. DSM 45060 TaxID=1798224 RepID=UPI0008799A9D|nr:erythromycin esterase family protein [Jiangella sp. DSM 45060]SDT67861.1 erythromycin esterase [Jiangella sp. DSM 45060]
MRPLPRVLALSAASALVAGACAVTVVATALAAAGDSVVRGLDRRAHPLTGAPGDGDLGPFGRMIGDAGVVRVGAAAHASAEFVTTKRRLLRYLAEHEGFRTFAQQVGWSTGVLLDDYVVHGAGDPRAIIGREPHDVVDAAELLALVEWIRGYNLDHDQPVRFVGAGVGHAGPVVVDRVVAYAAGVHPDLAARLTELYAVPPAEREHRRDTAVAAYELVAALPDDGDEHAWAVQHARSIVQHTTASAFDLTTPEGRAAHRRYRDDALAANVVWWQRQTGHRIVLSTQHGDVDDVVLRDALGAGYVSTGFTGADDDVLGRVRYDDYLIDLRRVTGPARRWLAAEAAQAADVPPGRGHDLLIHLGDVRQSRLPASSA